MSALPRGAAQPVHEKALVTAPAGSGKTVQLVRRYLSELSRGATPPRVVAITFTRKAAAELVSRLGSVLRQASEGWPGSSNEDAALYRAEAPAISAARAALAALPNAPVSTVDSFVFDLVGELLLDACYFQSGPIWIDGPLRPAQGSSEAFEAGARAALETLDGDGSLTVEARTLLAEGTLAEAVSAVAALAQHPDDALDLSVAGLATNEGLMAAVRSAATKHHEELQTAGDSLADPLARLLAGPDGELLGKLASATTRSDVPAAVAQPILVVAGIAVGLPIDGGDVDQGLKEAAAWTAEAGARADAVRGAAWAVSRRARGLALRTLAQRGESTHAELLQAATSLCVRARTAEAGTPLARLRDRYDALLVDEVQDTSPDQLAFYEAFLNMRPGIRRFFVGDSRQSIYRFRGADLHGWAALLGSTPAEHKGELTVNYRSSASLVAAQRALFANLATLGAKGVDGLDTVEPRSGATSRLQASALLEEPVVVVASSRDHDVLESTLDAFAVRLGSEWQRADLLSGLDTGAREAVALQAGSPSFVGKTPVTAGVLLPTWTHAHAVARHLGRYGIAARVVGDRSLLGGQVGRDVRTLLAALLDTSDEIAWLGLLKHPSIGVRDGALPALRPFGKLLAPADDGAFPNPAWLAHLAADEALALRSALVVLRDARARVGREPTARLLDEVWTRLGWRPLVAAGPEGDVGLAQFDLLGDLARAAEADAVDPFAVLDALAPGEGDGDLPKVRLAHEGPVVEITTVHSAKGLEYDHVALPIDVCCPRGRGDAALVRVDRVCARGVLRVRVDPGAALSPTSDPWSAWVEAADRRERREESWRLLYVAFTRARESVTLGLGKPTSKGAHPRDLQRQAFGIDAPKRPKGADPLPLLSVEGLRVLSPQGEAGPGPLLTPPACVPARARATRALPPLACWVGPGGRRLRSPSRWAEGQADAGALAQAMRAAAILEVGPRAPSLPVPDTLPVRVRGDLVHAFLEHWGLRGEPDPTATACFLRERWQHDDPALAEALCAAGRHLLAALPSFRALITDAVALHFESPLFAAVAGDADGEDDVLIGRLDLLVEHPDGSVTIIDFKAGQESARLVDGVAEIPHLGTYAWQLRAYREALLAADLRVRGVGLVYVLGPSMALWQEEMR